MPDARSLDSLYFRLRELIDSKYKIEIRDGNEPRVSIVPDVNSQTHPWISFAGLNILDSLKRSIEKMQHPEQDYRSLPSIIDEDGMLWPANEESVYSEEHTRLFLKKEKVTAQ